MKTIIENEQFTRTLKRMTHEIIERNEDLSSLILVGIEKKGTPIAKEIQSLIFLFEGINVPVEAINITSYRDDEKKGDVKNILTENIKDKIIVLVDDVLFTGRSARAAMDAIMEVGRPSKIELAVFVDRGHRELPIRADFIGKNIPTSREEKVLVDFEAKTVSLK